MKAIYIKYKDIILYAIFGVLTTLVNIVSYWICAHLFEIPVMLSTVVAWFCAVLFAYWTNRKWVFGSMAHTKQDIAREMVTFFAARLTTGVIDWGCMLFFVDMMKLNDVIIKGMANVLVILLNYVASKLIIFKRK